MLFILEYWMEWARLYTEAPSVGGGRGGSYPPPEESRGVYYLTTPSPSILVYLLFLLNLWEILVKDYLNVLYVHQNIHNQINFSTVWFLISVFRDIVIADFFLWLSHSNGFSPVWILSYLIWNEKKVKSIINYQK